MKRRGIFLSILAVFAILSLGFFFNNARGQVPQMGNCDDSQVILRLFDIGNSHGADYTDSNYQYKVCFDEIFGTAYQGVNPHQCTGNNGILHLSSSTNAHAEILSQSNYNFNVCYGVLSCTNVPGGSSCPNGKQEIVTLSGTSNAHIELRDTNTYDASGFNGGQKICCGVADLDSAVWQDMAGNDITGSFVNRTVKLVAYTGFGSGTSVTFTLKEDDSGFTGGDDSVAVLSGTTDASGKAAVNWFINDSTMANVLEAFDGNTAEFYFVADVGGVQKTSGILNVINQQGSNSPPTAVITGPLHRQIYFQGTSVNFTQASYDIESPLTYSWNISEDNFVSTQSDFSYTFTTAGQKTITLRVTDSAGLWDEDQIAVLVIGNPGLLAFINKPAHHQVINNALLTVNIMANDSYVVSSSVACSGSLTGSVACLAGNCPTSTQNSPPTCSGNVPVSGGALALSGVNFDWKFNDGTSFSGLGMESGTKVFALASNQLNDKSITLNVSYSNGGVLLSKTTSRQFTLFGTAQCINGGTTFIEINNSGEIVGQINTMQSNACAGADSFAGTGDDCCPGGMVCGNNGCVIGSDLVDSCSDYTTKNSCEDDLQGVSDILDGSPNDPLVFATPQCGSVYNGGVVQCSCAWNSTGNECGLKKKIQNVTTQSPCTISQCLYTNYQQSECIGGVMTVQATPQIPEGVAVPGFCGGVGETCPQINEVVPCGKAGVELGFFGWKEFIVGVILIIVIYLALAKKKAGKKRRKK